MVEGYPALLLDKHLIIADLHIGYEIELREKGISLPSLVDEFLLKLSELKERTKARELHILGDVKHSVTSPKLEEIIELTKFFDKCLELFEAVHVVPGNHDGSLSNYIAKEVKLYSPRGTILKVRGVKYGLLHGHAIPTREVFRSKVLIVAHLHFKLKYQNLKIPVWLKVKQEDRQIVFIPPFNTYLPGQPLGLDAPTLPFIPQDRLYEAEVYTLEGYYLGRIKELDRAIIEVEGD